MDDTKPQNVTHKVCSVCEETKTIEHFYKLGHGLVCRNCNNYKRRQRYKNDEEFVKALESVIKDYANC